MLPSGNTVVCAVLRQSYRWVSTERICQACKTDWNVWGSDPSVYLINLKYIKCQSFLHPCFTLATSWWQWNSVLVTSSKTCSRRKKLIQFKHGRLKAWSQSRRQESDEPSPMAHSRRQVKWIKVITSDT